MQLSRSYVIARLGTASVARIALNYRTKIKKFWDKGQKNWNKGQFVTWATVQLSTVQNFRLANQIRWVASRFSKYFNLPYTFCSVSLLGRGVELSSIQKAGSSMLVLSSPKIDSSHWEGCLTKPLLGRVVVWHSITWSQASYQQQKICTQL